MDKQAVIQQLKTILSEDLFVAVPPDAMKETDSIAIDLGLDSVGFVELATIVGEKFQIAVEEAAVTDGQFATLESIYAYIVARKAVPAGA